MNDELKAAAERVRRHINQLGNSAIEDRNMLVRAYLAEHPADDDEPVTVEWLASISRQPPIVTAIGNCYRFSIDSDRGLCVWGRACGVGYTVTLRTVRRSESGHRMTSFSDLRDVYYRGDIRRLCAALGIPLTESPPARRGK